MSFSVEPDTLDSYAEFLDEIAMSAIDVKSFINRNTDMGVREEGLLNSLAIGHDTIVKSMSDRTRKMNEIARGSGSEVTKAADYYRETEDSNAAAIDETYPGADAHQGKYEGRGSDRNVPPPTTSWTEFARPDVLSELKIEGIPSESEMKASKVEDWARTGLTAISVTGAARLVLANLVGFDFIDWIRTWWIGEWTVWAKSAATWEACAGGTELIAENVHQATNTLHGAWEGQAAEAAEVYFEQFRDAIYTESDAFGALHGFYEFTMEFIYELHLLVNDVVNTVLDIVFTLLTMGGSKGVGAAIKLAVSGGWVNKIIGYVSYAGTILSIASDFVQLWETFTEADDLEEVPACEFDKLKGHHYKHPGHGEEF